MSRESIDRELEQAEFNYRIFLIFFWVIFAIIFYCTLSFNFRHTYQLPVDSPGVLVSDRWTFQYVREWLFFLYLLMLISGPFMRLSKTKEGVGIHIFVLVLLMIFCILTVGADTITLRSANVGPSDPSFDPANLATDNRWCCVHGGSPGTELVCANNRTVAECPAISENELRSDSVFVLRFALNLILGGMIAYDLLVVWLSYWPLLNEYLRIIKSV